MIAPAIKATSPDPTRHALSLLRLRFPLLLQFSALEMEPTPKQYRNGKVLQPPFLHFFANIPIKIVSGDSPQKKC